MSTAAAMTLAADPPWWRDPRLLVPGAFLGASVIAVAAWALLRRVGPAGAEPARDPYGLSYADAGYVLCPQGLGLTPTPKQISVGDFVVVWLANANGSFVEATWARVVRVDPLDGNRLLVLLGTQYRPGLATLKTEEHGFSVDQALWVTADCIADVLRTFNGGRAAVLCGETLMDFSSASGVALVPAALPAAPADLVGRVVDLLLISRGSGGHAWQAPARARVLEVSETGQVATVELVDVAAPGASAYGPMIAGLKPGALFDITWDCVIGYGTGELA